ncbi:putative disease resistance protein RGA3 isoform X2 [Miscanthus floridulus]|uniref:putative disease resistance protein RGA3 isoform X2 n=1 Tax=Miscanthus floridulus TaxID=154761 RepID=UPI003458319B
MSVGSVRRPQERTQRPSPCSLAHRAHRRGTVVGPSDSRSKDPALIPRALSCLPVACKKITLANKMKSIREQLKKINKQFRDFNFTLGGTTTCVEKHEDVRETSSCLSDKPIIGRNIEKKEIINLLCAGSNNEETSIVAIYGLGGMGKSTLAQQIYNDVGFKKYDHRIWVYVSRDFSLRKIGTSIISLLPIEGGQQNRDTMEAINQCIDNQLHGKKILIILDDLWEEKDTELGKLRSMLHVGKKGGMIDVIVTTPNEDIARNVSTSKAYKLQPLKDDTCWEIIKRTSKFEHKHNQERLKQIGLDIAKKCGGMALAAQAVGYLLQSKDLSGWTEINNSDIWNKYSEDDGHNIAEDDLIRQWTALNFIKPSMGKEYIRQLLGMSFLQVSKLPSTFEEHMAQYTMHDLVHDLATLIMADELIASGVASKSNNEHGKRYCRYALVTKYDQAQATKLSCILPSKVRALHFSDCNKLELASGAFSFAKCLRILDFSGCSSIQLPASIGKLKQLKYLLAPRMQNEVLPEYITELDKLQYLNMEGSSGISALPESIGKLAGSLEFLGLSGCSGISKLPASFGDFKCLVHLNMSYCTGIKELSDSLGDLTNLQHLELFDCSRLKTVPVSLCGLKQLKYLNLERCRYIVRLPESIGCLVDLQYLNMPCCGVREFPESFKRFGNLLHLDLAWSSIDKGLPGSLCGLTALQHLDMSMMPGVNFEKDDLPDAMRNLTNLKVLDLSGRLYRCFDVEKNDGYLDFIWSIWTYRTMKYLSIYQKSIGDLKRLHTLNLKHCYMLKYLPESIGGATGLKSLILDRCSHEVMDQASSLLHYSLTIPLFKVRADDVSGHSNLHLLQGESHIDELNIVSLENVRFLEEARRLELSAKQSLVDLTLSWTSNADRLIEDMDLLGELVPPMSLESFRLNGYSSPSFPSWLMTFSHHHLPNLTRIVLFSLPKCWNLPPLGQLPCLQNWTSVTTREQTLERCPNLALASVFFAPGTEGSLVPVGNTNRD